VQQTRLLDEAIDCFTPIALGWMRKRKKGEHAKASKAVKFYNQPTLVGCHACQTLVSRHPIVFPGRQVEKQRIFQFREPIGLFVMRYTALAYNQRVNCLPIYKSRGGRSDVL